MSMSRDRVRFTIKEGRLTSSFSSDLSYRDKLRQLLNEVFGLDIKRGETRAITIVCRPSQFARFVILRNDIGLTNGFKELSPELFTPEPESPEELTFNVAKNPNTIRSDV